MPQDPPGRKKIYRGDGNGIDSHLAIGYHRHTMNTSTSLFAKALATENIFVSFDSTAKTATFDVSSRTLIIPDWKVSNVLRDMIVAHEVAHALFTPAADLLSAMDKAKQRKLHSDGYKACINVIEDARIERAIKEKFPGCRRDFYSGYKEIIDTDLFELKSLDLDNLSIIDKVNLHFKFGIFGLMNIALNDAEQKFIDRVAAAKSFDEVIALADELYALQEEEDKQKGRSRPVAGNTGDLTDAMRKVEKDGNADAAHNGNSVRYEDFPHLSYPLPKCNSNAAIIPFEDILIDTRAAVALAAASYARNGDAGMFADALGRSSERLEAFRKESASTVRELVAQFERRKAAEDIRKEREKPTGTINPDRLHQFKTHDDIFLRNTVKREGKKHGMVMLIDWSGSMSDCIDGVVRQLLTLTWFCRKAKIPYEVFIYTERGGFADKGLNIKYNSGDYATRFTNLYGAEYVRTMNMGKTNHFGLSDISLRQVFSSSMTDAEMVEMEQMMWRFVEQHDRQNLESMMYHATEPPCVHMQGTPSCEALMAIYDYMPKFQAATGAQVVDFIFITDGEPTGLGRSGSYAYTPVKSVRVQNLASGRTLTVEGGKRGYVDSLNLNIQYFLADELRKMGCVTVGFSIGSMSGIGSHFLNKFVREVKKGDSALALEGQDKAYNDFYKKENFLPCSPERTPGFDEYYLIRPVKPLSSEDDPKINANTSTLTKIRNQFLKSLTNRKCSRVFLSRFIDLISGRSVKRFKLMG